MAIEQVNSCFCGETAIKQGKIVWSLWKKFSFSLSVDVVTIFRYIKTDKKNQNIEFFSENCGNLLSEVEKNHSLK